MSNDLAIKISAANAADATLKAARKEVLALEKALASCSDEAERDAVYKAWTKATKAVDEATDAARAANKELAKSREVARGTETAWERVNRTVIKHQNAIRNAGLVAGAALVLVAKKSIDAASSLQESTSKVNAVFGSQSAELEAWSMTSATAFGQSRQQALEAAGTYGNLFQAFGIGRDKAAEMSMSLTELAADLASFNNTSIDDALEALRSGLSGETEPLKRFGVALTDDRLKAEALAQGIYDGKGVLDAAQKSQAAYALILRDTTLAQGDFARTSDGLANSQRIAQAELQNTLATIGQDLIPVVTNGAQVFATLIRIVGGMPEPLRAIVMGVTAFSIAAMIALPRIITITAATKAWARAQIEAAGASTRMGAAKAVGAAAMGAVMGPAGLATAAVVGLTVAYGAWVNAQENAKQAAGDFASTLDQVTGAATEATYGQISKEFVNDLAKEDRALLEQHGITIAELTRAAVDGGDEYEAVMAKLDAAQSKYGASNSELWNAVTGARSSLRNQAETVYDGKVAYEAAAEATREATIASRDNATQAAIAAYQQDLATQAAQRRTDAEKLLASGFDKATRLMAQSQAKRQLAAAKEAFAKKPTADNAFAVTSAAMNLAAQYKNPQRQMKVIQDQFPELVGIIDNSGLKQSMQDQAIAPLQAMIDKAKEAKTALDEAFAAEQRSRQVSGINPRNLVVGAATGGLITGPGTGTSDSIPARLSNGEYVIRAAAVSQIGVPLLEQLNRVDRIPGGLPSVTLPTSRTVGRDEPRLRVPASRVVVMDGGSSAPLVGQMVLQNPSGVDVQLELASLARRQAREQRTRYARAER